MIFIIELDEKDIKTLNLYRALEIIWGETTDYDVISYDDEKEFKANVYEHIDSPNVDSDNFIYYIDTKKQIAEVRNIKIDATIVKVVDTDKE